MADFKYSSFGRDDFRVLKKETVFKGFFQVDKYYLQHKRFAGDWTGEFTREVFERGDAVVLIPYDPVNDTIVMNEQFRAGALRANEYPWLLEFIAGMFSESEDPVDAAIREAKEEANLTITQNDVLPVLKYLSSPGGTSERMHIYVAKVNSENVGGVFGLVSENEDIRTQVISRTAAETLLAQGRIINAASIIGLQWLSMNYRVLQQKWC